MVILLDAIFKISFLGGSCSGCSRQLGSLHIAGEIDIGDAARNNSNGQDVLAVGNDHNDKTGKQIGCVFLLEHNDQQQGKTDSRQKIYDMAESLRQKHGLDVQCILTKKQGHATELAKKLCETGEALRFYACGGDGTVNEVANGIIGYDNAAMTVIPVGTGNDFLKNFGDDMEKFRDAENLWDGPQFPMDAIDVNGRVALTIACSGIDARVARDVHKYSESPLLDGKGSYIYSLAVNFLFKGIGTHWTITLDDVTTEGDWSLVSVCNGRYYGGGFMPVAEARMDDGVLNTLVVREVNRRTFLKFVGPYSRGEYAKFPEYAHCSCPKVVHIHSEKPDIVTCLDGESVVNSDVTIKLHDKKLNFFGPEGCSCNRTARG